MTESELDLRDPELDVRDPDLNLRDPEWLAEQLGIEKNTIYKYLSDGVIPALKIGKKWLVDPADIKEFLASERRQQTIERRARVWLLAEITRLAQEPHSLGSVVATPALVADVARVAEYEQARGFGGRHMPDVPWLMEQAGIHLEWCDKCKAAPALAGGRYMPTCYACMNAWREEFDASFLAANAKGGDQRSQFE